MIPSLNFLHPQIPSLLKRLLHRRTLRHSRRERRILRRRQKQRRDVGWEPSFGETIRLFVAEVEVTGAVPVEGGGETGTTEGGEVVEVFLRGQRG